MKHFLTTVLIGCTALASLAAAVQTPVSQRSFPVSEQRSDLIVNTDRLLPGRSDIAGMEKAPMKVSSPGDVITKVQGEKQTYLKACAGYILMINYVQYYEDSGVYAEIVKGDDGDVYFHDFISGAAEDTYIKGQIEGNEITVNFPQTITWIDAYGVGLDLVALKYESAEDGRGTYIYDPSVESVTFSISEDGTIAMDSLGEDYIVGTIWEDDETWTGYGDMIQIYTPTEFDMAEIPQDAKIERYVNFRGESGYIVDVAVSGDELYIRGLCQDVPAGTIKGKIKDGKVYFESNQIAGVYGGVYLVYLRWMVAGDEVDEYIMGPEDEPYVMDFDSDNNVLKVADTDKILIFNFYPDFLRPLSEYPNLTLQYQASAAGTPGNPYDLEYSDRFFGYYGYYSFTFDIPLVTEDKVVLDTDYLYYRIFIDGELTEFTDEDYKLGEYTSLTDIPFDFTNSNDFYSWSNTRREVGIYADGVTSAGVQSIYKYDGETTVSDVVTLDVRSGKVTLTSGVHAVSDEPNNVVVRTEYFDCNGLPVVRPVKGIYLERQTLENGETKVIKRVAR